MLPDNAVFGYPKDIFPTTLRGVQSLTSNPFTIGNRPDHVDKVLVLPMVMVKELGVLEFYGTVAQLRAAIASIIGKNKLHIKYWLSLLQEMLPNSVDDLVAVVYGGPCADADLQILELVDNKVTDATVYENHLNSSCGGWSISVFSALLSELKLMYLCGGFNTFSSFITKKIASI